MEKSIISMEKKICPICGKEFETDSLLLQTRSLKHPQAKKDQGFIAFIVIDPTKSNPDENGLISPSDAWRLGVVV